MSVLDPIRDLYGYNRWANERVLEATAALDAERFTRDMGSSFPSVRDTLIHVLSSDWVWLERWHGRSPAARPAEWVLETHAQVAERWRAIQDEREAFIETLSPASLETIIDYRTTRGEPYRGPLEQLLRHVVNHSTYHRGQITTMLRQLGATPASTDLVAYHRTLAAR